MKKTYTVTVSEAAQRAGMESQTDVICEILPDNGQGLEINQRALVFTCPENNIVVFAPGIWATVTSV